MELVFPWVLYIGIPIIIVLVIFRFKKKHTYVNGKKVANTKYIEELPYYKKIVKRYQILQFAVKLLYLICIAICICMIARPATIETIDPNASNRDIFLCMDVSGSMYGLNSEICGKLKETVKGLNGERFGITIFNGQAVLAVPLTKDYEYIIKSLDTMQTAFDQYNNGQDYTEYDHDAFSYINGGTSSSLGSSLIGDGLASCVYNFSDLEEDKDRSRIIIFSTDNYLAGDSTVSLDEATDLCKKKNIRVYGLTIQNVNEELNFKNAIEKTGGKFYKCTSNDAVYNIINEIEKIETSDIEDKILIITDRPKILFICLLVVLFILFILQRKVEV